MKEIILEIVIPLIALIGIFIGIAFGISWLIARPDLYQFEYTDLDNQTHIVDECHNSTYGSTYCIRDGIKFYDIKSIKRVRR